MVKKTRIVSFLLFQIFIGLYAHGISPQEKLSAKSETALADDTTKVKNNQKIQVSKILKGQKPNLPKVEIPKVPKIDSAKVAGIKIPKSTGGVFSRDSLKAFYKDFKILLAKHKFRKPSLKSQIFSLKDTISARIDSIKALQLKLEVFKINEKLLGDVIKRLSPSLNGPLIEWSLHAIEESKHLNLYDSKRYYKTEIQWAEYSGRDKDDDRHVCPLQLDVIERCLTLWSNPGDVVFDPFSGVGSTGVPTDKSIIPSLYERAISPKGAKASHGKSGSCARKKLTHSLEEGRLSVRDLY